jgi:predicted phage baseplate assembly protein
MEVNDLTGLNDCGCCEGLTQETPALIENRAGLSAIAYRVGTHSRFKASMLARLSDADLSALKALMTREDDDFSIALLDAWASVADVLTFYQERIANENYLRTATERNSLLQLARLIGYKLRPGVAASTYVAFTVEDTSQATNPAPVNPAKPPPAWSAVGTALIDIGTKLQSIPGPNEQSQTFETIEKITGYAVWNAMKARQTLPQPLATGMDEIVFEGTATNLNKGDALLIVVPNSSGGTDQALRRVASVAPEDKTQQTTVELVTPTKPKFTIMLPTFAKGGFSVGALPFNDSTVDNVILNKTWNASELDAFANVHGFSVDELYASIRAKFKLSAPTPESTGAFAMRKRAALFGYNAPDWNAMATDTQQAYKTLANDQSRSDWPAGSFDGNEPAQLSLDQVYKEIKAGDWVVVVHPTKGTVIAPVKDVTETAASFFAISGQVTQITFDSSVDVTVGTMKELRRTTVYIVPEQLTPAELTDSSDVQGNSIQLDGPYPELYAGRTVIVSGTRADLAGVTVAEAAVIADVTLAGGFTTLTFVAKLTHPYLRDTVTINANVALATNGETTGEVLGNGDASQAYQQFQLKQSPLTYVSSTSPRGADSTLQVFVNDVQWHEMPSLLDAVPNDRVFVTDTSDDNKTTIEFGDGSTGLRVPTGQQNVRAVYRKGIGTGGNVKAGQLSLLLTRPLGVKAVVNPMAASGGADNEMLEDARTNAPITVLTLDRVVSLSDYEDFARAFAGIAKALATWTWDGQTRGVFVTVAGPNGADIPDGSKTLTNLIAAMQAAGDPHVPLRVQTYRRAFFRTSALIDVNPDYQQDKVLAAVTDALRTEFSFDSRAFGQGVALSEVLAAMQSVVGVVAVDMNELYRVEETPGLNSRLLAAMPQAGTEGSVQPAELLILDPSPIDLGVMS